MLKKEKRVLIKDKQKKQEIGIVIKQDISDDRRNKIILALGSNLGNRVDNIEKIKPEIISTGNIGCITQISNGTKIPILHTVEIIDWYTGRPKPDILKKI